MLNKQKQLLLIRINSKQTLKLIYKRHVTSKSQVFHFSSSIVNMLYLELNHQKHFYKHLSKYGKKKISNRLLKLLAVKVIPSVQMTGAMFQKIRINKGRCSSLQKQAAFFYVFLFS